MKVVLRSEAKQLGLTRYFTGKPCLHGHLSERFTSCTKCTKCALVTAKSYVAKQATTLDATKTCGVCKTNKTINEFAKHSSGKYGVAATCKACKKVYRDNWYIQNKAECLIKSAQWAKENVHKKRSYRAKRRAALLNATPLWADAKAIEYLYKQATILSKNNLKKYEVDHIIPLQGKTVSGLHVPWNLQIIPTTENRSKGNRI
jgi:hypothetical protein